MAAERELEYDLQPGALNEAACAYWADELRGRGMSYPQVLHLLKQPGVLFHDLVEMLDCGCPPNLAFDIVSDDVLSD